MNSVLTKADRSRRLPKWVTTLDTASHPARFNSRRVAQISVTAHLRLEIRVLQYACGCGAVSRNICCSVDGVGLGCNLVTYRFSLFQVQRYEGASTVYGPHTLTIYLNQYRNLSAALVKVSVTVIIGFVQFDSVRVY